MESENQERKPNIVLIGMPGAGKSTVGVILAKRLGLEFVDSDLRIQTRTGRHLQEIIDGEGLDAFRRIEEEVLCGLHPEGAVIATGGSVVYSDRAMMALRRQGTVVFLDVPLADLTRRIQDMDRRGLVIDPGQSFAGLYRERLPLYRQWADRVIDCAGKYVEGVAAEIVRCLEAEGFSHPGR